MESGKAYNFTLAVALTLMVLAWSWAVWELLRAVRPS